jgi:protein-tyrosine phosphatase
MVPLVDTHCHLLPHMDDGPSSWEEAVSMCRIAWEEGVRGVAATVHQNEHWPQVTRAGILEGTAELTRRLAAADIPLAVYPAAEVMVAPDFEDAWRGGRLVTMADRGQYLLIELPHRVYLEIQGLVSQLVEQGVRPILAHPERHPELLNHEQAVEDLIARGCLLQVSAASIAEGRSPEISQGVRRWARRRMIHLVGSDGHSSTRRPPGIRAAHEELARWEGRAYADQVCSANGMAVLEGLPLYFRGPKPKRTWGRLERLLLR